MIDHVVLYWYFPTNQCISDHSLVFHPVELPLEGDAAHHQMAICSHQPRAESKFCILHHTPLLTRFQVFSPWDLSSSAGGHLQTIPNQTNHWCWSSPPPRPRPLPAQTPPPQRPQRCSPVLLHGCQLLPWRNRISVTRLLVSLYFSAFLCISLHFSTLLFISLHFPACLYISPNFSVFLWISLRFSAFLCISLRFSVFLWISLHFATFLSILHSIY